MSVGKLRNTTPGMGKCSLRHSTAGAVSEIHQPDTCGGLGGVATNLWEAMASDRACASVLKAVVSVSRVMVRSLIHIELSFVQDDRYVSV